MNEYKEFIFIFTMILHFKMVKSMFVDIFWHNQYILHFFLKFYCNCYIQYLGEFNLGLVMYVVIGIYYDDVKF